LEITSRVTGQAKKFAHAMAGRIQRGHRAAWHKAKKQLDQMRLPSKVAHYPELERVAEESKKTQ
jgi:hypothetical protein